MSDRIILDPKLIIEFERWSKVLYLPMTDTVDFVCRFGKYVFNEPTTPHKYKIPKDRKWCDGSNRDDSMYLSKNYHLTRETITEAMAHIELCGNRLPVWEYKIPYKSVRIPARFKDTFDGLKADLQVKPSKLFRYIDLLIELNSEMFHRSNNMDDIRNAYINTSTKSSSNHCQAYDIVSSLHNLNYDTVKSLNVAFKESPKKFKLSVTTSKQLWDLSCMLGVRRAEVFGILDDLDYAVASIGTKHEDEAMAKVDMLTSDGEITECPSSRYTTITYDEQKVIDQIEYWALNLRMIL